MKTNLIFQRTVITEGITRTEMKAVEVEIPNMSSKDGWKLQGTVDKLYIDNECSLSGNENDQK